MAQPTSFVRARVRGAVDRVLVRVRGALDLPSRAEMIDLTDRLEQLDRRISELAAERVAELSRATPALPAPEIEASETAIAAAEPESEAASEPVDKSDQSAPERVRRSSSRRASARTGKR
jgi:hypothetical protein